MAREGRTGVAGQDRLRDGWPNQNCDAGTTWRPTRPPAAKRLRSKKFSDIEMPLQNSFQSIIVAFTLLYK